MATKVKFSVEIKWGAVDEQPDSDTVPQDFHAAYKIWESKDPNRLSEACRLIAQHLKCLFIPDNVMGIEEILDEKWDQSEDIEASSLEVLKLDFSEGIIPSVTARACLEIPLKSNFNLTSLESWQEENDYLDSGVCFQFHLENNEDFLGPLWNHSGLSCSIEQG